MKANGSPVPVFETDDERSYFLIRLPAHEGFADDENAAPVPLKQVIDLGKCVLAAKNAHQ